MEFTIRDAAESDVQQIVNLIGELAAYEKLSHESAPDPDRLREHLFGERRHAEVLVAEHQSAVVGFALFFHNYSTFLTRPGIYLEDLYVPPAFRRRGIGTALLRSVARRAVERECGRLEWAVLDWNEPALRFYRSLGARPLEEWTLQRVTGAALLALAAPAPGTEEAGQAEPS